MSALKFRFDCQSTPNSHAATTTSLILERRLDFGKNLFLYGQLTALASTTKNHRCQPDSFAKKLKAAPLFCWCVRLRNELMGTFPYNGTHSMMAHLVA